MNYKVKLDIFEGPFDLLVYLIEKNKMSIYDIQISEITAQYIEYIEKIPDSKMCKIITTSKEYLIISSINNIIKILDNRFCKCHRSVIINLEKILI